MQLMRICLMNDMKYIQGYCRFSRPSEKNEDVVIEDLGCGLLMCSHEHVGGDLDARPEAHEALQLERSRVDLVDQITGGHRGTAERGLSQL